MLELWLYKLLTYCLCECKFDKQLENKRSSSIWKLPCCVKKLRAYHWFIFRSTTYNFIYYLTKEKYKNGRFPLLSIEWSCPLFLPGITLKVMY